MTVKSGITGTSESSFSIGSGITLQDGYSGNAIIVKKSTGVLGDGYFDNIYANNINGSGIDAENVVALRAINGTHNSVTLDGYSSKGDGGEGLFVWTTDTTTIDNAGTVIVPTASPRIGCWKRAYNDFINVKWFGVKGDGITDDTISIQNVLNKIGSSGGAVYIPEGIYITSQTLTVKSGTKLFGNGWNSIIKCIPATGMAGPALLVNDVNGYNWTIFDNFCITTTTAAHDGYANAGIEIYVVTTTITNMNINGADAEFIDAGLVMKQCLLANINHSIIYNCLGCGIKFKDGPSYRISIGPENNIRENYLYAIDCNTFGASESSEVHIFNNDIESNNRTYPITLYQINGCIGPGSIVGNHIESAGGSTPDPDRAGIFLGPYGRATRIEGNNFAGPRDEYAIIANYGTGAGLIIRGNSFSSGSIANVWLQSVFDAEIGDNAYYAGVPTKLDVCPGLRYTNQGLMASERTNYISTDYSIALTDQVIIVNGDGNINLTLPDPTCYYTAVKKFEIKNYTDGYVSVISPTAIIENYPTNTPILLYPSEICTFSSCVETDSFTSRYIISNTSDGYVFPKKYHFEGTVFTGATSNVIRILIPTNTIASIIVNVLGGGSQYYTKVFFANVWRRTGNVGVIGQTDIVAESSGYATVAASVTASGSYAFITIVGDSVDIPFNIFAEVLTTTSTYAGPS